MGRRFYRAPGRAFRLSFGRKRQHIGTQATPRGVAVYAAAAGLALAATAPAFAGERIVYVEAPSASATVLAPAPEFRAGFDSFPDAAGAALSPGGADTSIALSLVAPTAPAVVRGGAPAVAVMRAWGVDAPGAGVEVQPGAPVAHVYEASSFATLPAPGAVPVAAVAPGWARSIVSPWLEPTAGSVSVASPAPAVTIAALAFPASAPVPAGAIPPAVTAVRVAAPAPVAAGVPVQAVPPAFFVAQVVEAAPPAASALAIGSAPGVVLICLYTGAPAAAGATARGGAPVVRVTVAAAANSGSVAVLAPAPAVRVTVATGAPAGAVAAAGTAPEAYALPAPATGYYLGWDASGKLVNLSPTQILDSIASTTPVSGWWIDTGA